MARGYQAVYTSLFPDSIVQAPQQERPGRNAELHDKRTECLVDRYYYYVVFFRQYRYEYVLEVLSNEFFLSPFRISKLLIEYSRQLARLRKDKPDVKYFKSKWQHLVW